MTLYRLVEVDRFSGLALHSFGVGFPTIADAAWARKNAEASRDIPYSSALVIVPMDDSYPLSLPVGQLPTRDVEEVIRLVETLTTRHGIEPEDRPQLTLNDVEWHPSYGYIIAGATVEEYLHSVYGIDAMDEEINERSLTNGRNTPHNPPKPLAWAV